MYVKYSIYKILKSALKIFILNLCSELYNYCTITDGGTKGVIDDFKNAKTKSSSIKLKSHFHNAFAVQFVKSTIHMFCNPNNLIVRIPSVPISFQQI